MHCPFCGVGNTRVIDSRLVGGGNQVRRRRECLACKERFTTSERADLSLPRVIKRDGSRVPFNEEKLRAGLLRALEKRPVSNDRFEAAIGRILHNVISTGEREIRSRQIGEYAMQQLREMDEIAYVRFASVYRSFQDINEFREEIERLQKEPSLALQRQQLSLLPEK